MSEWDATREEGEHRPFFEGDDFETGFVSSVFEGETIFTAEEVEAGRRNRAISADRSSYAQGGTRWKIRQSDHSISFPSKTRHLTNHRRSFKSRRSAYLVVNSTDTETRRTRSGTSSVGHCHLRIHPRSHPSTSHLVLLVPCVHSHS